MGAVDWIDLAQDWGKGISVVQTVMNIVFAQNGREF
jgi:hypothetical protein